jgi:RimJ/RimL family protein N-acetyltransferase
VIPYLRFPVLGALRIEMNIDWKNISTIHAARVSLRPMTDNDAALLYEIYSDPEVMRYWGGAPMKNPREIQDFLAGIGEDLRQRRCIQWGIARRTDNRIIGTFAFFGIDAIARKAEIGFALGRAHWGMGYMREALQAALGYGFNEMELRRIEADVDPRNLSSIRLLERVGFRSEGYLRERWLVAGETEDSVFYGLLRREWSGADAVYEIAPRTDAPKYSLAYFRALVGNSRLGRYAAMLLGLLDRL